MDPQTAKQALRARLLTHRATRPETERRSVERALAAHASARAAGAGAVAAYAGVGDEPRTRTLLDALRAAGTLVLLPVLAPGRTLVWAAYDGWEALETSPFGLLQPTGARQPPDALAALDLVLAPALAVDRAGHRLGRGAGYYDRALAAVPRERVLAVVHDDEVLADVPFEPHDRRVGGALTPSGVVPLG